MAAKGKKRRFFLYHSTYTGNASGRIHMGWVIVVSIVLLLALSLGILSQVPQGQRNPIWLLFHAPQHIATPLETSAPTPTLYPTPTVLGGLISCNLLVDRTIQPIADFGSFADIHLPSGTVVLRSFYAPADNVVFKVATATLCSPLVAPTAVLPYYDSQLRAKRWGSTTGQVPDDGYRGHRCRDVALACWVTGTIGNGPMRWLSITKPFAQANGSTYTITLYLPPAPPNDVSQCWTGTSATFPGVSGLSLQVGNDPNPVPIPWYNRQGTPLIRNNDTASFGLYYFCGPGHQFEITRFLNTWLLRSGWTVGTFTLPSTTTKRCLAEDTSIDGWMAPENTSIDGWIAPDKQYGLRLMVSVSAPLRPVGTRWVLQACGLIFG